MHNQFPSQWVAKVNHDLLQGLFVTLVNRTFHHCLLSLFISPCNPKSEVSCPDAVAVVEVVKSAAICSCWCML